METQVRPVGKAWQDGQPAAAVPVSRAGSPSLTGNAIRGVECRQESFTMDEMEFRFRSQAHVEHS